MTDNLQHSQFFTMVTEGAVLEEVADLISKETEIAVDLEMDSLHHYREKVCLIQISTRHRNWLIDPLSIGDISVLSEPLASENIRIVMHGADYDVRSLYRDYSIAINNMFDTMIASRLLGVTEFGLAALLKARFDIELDKKFQKADWSKRPLNAEMCAYAVSDTAYLLDLYDQLRDELIQKGRLGWLEEECRLVSQARASEKDGPLFLGCKGAGKLKGYALAILEALLQLRECLARETDRPTFKVFSVETLMEIAERKPRNKMELSSIKGMTPSLIQKHGDKLLNAVSIALSMHEDGLPVYPRQKREEPSDGAKERLKILKSWRQQASNNVGLDAGVMAPNWLLEGIAEANPASAEGLANIAGMREWQRELYGGSLLKELWPAQNC